MGELEKYKEAVKEIALRNNDCYYDTKVLATAVYLILEQMVDRKTEPLDKDTNVRSKEPQTMRDENYVYAYDKEQCEWSPIRKVENEPQTDCAWKGEQP